MVQYLRPDSNVTQTSFTGGFAEIDEVTASDADFAYGANNTAAVLEVGLSNPSGAVTTSVPNRIRFRYAKTKAGTVDGGGNAVTIECQLYQGTSLQTSSGALTCTGTWQEFDWEAATGLITDWTDLRLRFTTSASGGSPANRRGAAVSWAVFEIPDQATAINPANASHSHSATSPTIAAFSSVTPDNATHSHSATSPTVTVPGTPITPDNSAHSHSATSPTIAANSVITAANCNHSHNATSPTIATNSTITSDNATHGHSATSPTVAANSVITVANCNHTHSATEPTVTFNTITVTPANCNHAHSATEPVVTSSVTSFTADNCSHGLESDNVILLFTPKRRRRVIRGKALHARSSWRRVGMSGYSYVS